MHIQILMSNKFYSLYEYYQSEITGHKYLNEHKNHMHCFFSQSSTLFQATS